MSGTWAGTPVFSSARFLRFRPREIRRLGAAEELTGDPPSPELEAGGTYELELLQFVPEGGDGAGSFHVATDKAVVRLLGEPVLRIGSRYDKPVLQLTAPPPPGYGTRASAVVIDADQSTTGPRLELPVRVKSSRRGAVAKTGLTTFGLVLLALPAAFHHPSTLLRASVVIGGALLAAWVQVFGAPTPRFDELPDWGRSPDPAAPSANSSGTPSGGPGSSAPPADRRELA
jgi:hypothetical protein